MKSYKELKLEIRTLERKLGAAKRQHRTISKTMMARVFLPIANSLLLKTDKALFAKLFNIKAKFLGSSSRLRWSENFFEVTDRTLPKFCYRIRHQYQCNMAYERGIAARAASLCETYFLDQIGFKSGDTLIDCGANVGDLKIWFDLNNVDINYIGFEPAPTEFSCLKPNVFPSIVHNVGLWKDQGKLNFYISSQGADSSLIQPADYESVVVSEVHRLDRYIESPIKCLKLEAEGAEPEILEGLGAKLSLVEYISADLGFERGVNEESTLVPVMNYLSNKDFELVDIQHGRITALFRNKSYNKSIPQPTG